MRDAVRAYCLRVGSDPLLAQGAGGNVSWKEGNTLWIKASGTRLADAGREDAFVPVELDTLRRSLANTPAPRLPVKTGSGTPRPSIETLMHVAMPHGVVAHLHAVEALAVLVRADAREILQARLDSRQAWEWVEYRQPGAQLARAVASALRRTPGAGVIFLQNHGILAGGETLDELHERVVGVISALEQAPGIAKAPLPPRGKSFPPSLRVGAQVYVAIQDARIQSMVHVQALYQRLSETWALYPDHVVFLGARAAVFETRNDAEQYGGKHLPLLFIRDEGVFAKPGLNDAQLAQLRCYYEVLVRQTPRDKLVQLSREDVENLLHWEAEQYRQQVSEKAVEFHHGPGHNTA